ncbi:MAG TPA: class I SAM-dependent DNA methyltransferase, partial [Bacteroidia bacterium]|nr:class I SAM-dependent DNA methyltransferase [Bacteroidia bacterium]HRS59990.1 class I SAM-dependent DNA methyltransferase [Bacteroidia bacterium]
QEFEKEKIVFQEMVQQSSFVYDLDKNYFCLDTGRIITGKNLKFLISILNSKFFFFAVKNFYGGGGLGETGVRMKHSFFENFVLKQLSESEQQPFVELVNQILAFKEQGKDTTALERQIDILVYHLYELTFEEAKIIDPELSEEDFEKYKIEK